MQYCNALLLKVTFPNTGHKPLGFHPKYLKLCSEDENNAFTSLERHGGK